jgi:hypothetical protein
VVEFRAAMLSASECSTSNSPALDAQANRARSFASHGLPHSHTAGGLLRRAAGSWWVQGQALITLGVLPPVISILRGLAFSAMGRRRVSTPAS